MASMVTSKASQLRYSTRGLFFKILRYGTLLPPFSHLSSQPPHHPHLVGNPVCGNGYLGLCQRFLSDAAATNAFKENPESDNTAKDGSGPGKESGEKDQKSDSAAATNTNKENPASDNAAKDGSGQGKESGEKDQKSDDGKPVRRSPVSWLSFLLLVLTGAGLVLYYDREKKRHIKGIQDASEAVKQGPSAGTAAIGGPFHLINHHGKHVTDKDFLGNWTLLYFGFTHCPDICPDELQKLAATVDKIKEKCGLEIVPVFISVDPERDTVEQVGEYVKEFHPNLIGLTGSPDEIKNVARAYRVYYMKTAEEDSDYLVDHSIVIYLMNPKMEFVRFFGKNSDADSIADGVIEEVRKYLREKRQRE
ncbi:hypothetical protein RJT34_17613 [Clitoria ternatea]|uniref:Thioredoxin domain-containing protein n=1 Tax=Clitoria ternatea TaxID=43366 RepID=A0AAN9JAJ2_CLITE